MFIDNRLKSVARTLCIHARRDPDSLEPGNAPYDTDEEAVDGTLPNGDPAHYSWREFVPRAKEILISINLTGLRDEIADELQRVQDELESQIKTQQDTLKMTWCLVKAAGGKIIIHPSLIMLMSSEDRLERYDSPDGKVTFRCM